MSSKEINIKLGHLNITIKRFEEGMADATQSRGIAIKDYLKILVDMKMPPAHQAEFLLHELNHMIYMFMNLKDKSTEEITVDTFAKAYCMVFLDNPHLYPILIKCLKDGKELPI